VPGRNNELTLKCCTSNCSMSCFSTRSLTLKVCGGVGPYTFEHTGSVKLKKGVTGTEEDEITTDRRDANPQINVVPPTNSGSAVSGEAYQLVIGSCNCGHSGGSDHACGRTGYAYGCNDQSLGADATPPGSGGTFVWVDHTCSCSTHEGHALAAPACAGVASAVSCGTHCTSANEQCHKEYGALEDVRTAQMILDGCVPCGVNQGATVTVTDAAGVSVSITLR
jgi:hypothetical protein